MDVLSTPRRPHKSPAHTVKDRMLAEVFVPRPAERFVRGSRLLYNHFWNRQHLFEEIFSDFGAAPFVGCCLSAAAIEGGRILTAANAFGKGVGQIFFKPAARMADITTPTWATATPRTLALRAHSCACRAAAGARH